MKEQNKLEVFNSMPVSQAVVRNAVPAMAAMLMTLIYNLADIFLSVRRMMLISLPPCRLQAPFF